MRIISFRTNHGPNVFHNQPTIVMTVDLEGFAEKASTHIDGFTARLLNTLPGLYKHTCSLGYAGGFVERLNTGTYMAHIIEHVAIELSAMSDIEVHYGKTRYAGQPGLYEIVTVFKNEEGMKECLRQAMGIVLATIYAHQPVIDLEIIKKKILASSLGPSGQALFDAAVKRNIPCRRIGIESLLQLGYGKNTRYVQSAVTNQTGLIAADIAQDKNLTKMILQENFISVPMGRVVSTVEELDEALAEMEAPFVIKPVNGNHGRGVMLDLQDRDSVLLAFEHARQICPAVIIEEMCRGNDYRILVVNGKFAAAAMRRPPQVIGDGKKTLTQLIEILNSDPRRVDGHLGTLSKVPIDGAVMETLKKNGIDSLEYVLEENETVVLRENANLSSGGSAIDMTDGVHPEVIQLCERAARVVGLDICGIDLIHHDIRKAPDFMTRVIEVNAGPGLRMHMSPCEGKPRDVGGLIMDMIYPDVEQSRIPIVAVTGTNGKTTVVRMLHKIFSDQLTGVGLTTTDGIWIDKQKIFEGDTTGPKSSRLILSDPKVSMAVLEVARGGLLRGGLAYDRSDVAVITNIRMDHIGQDGIDDLDDLVWIKSLVAERVKPGGTLILNADDERVLNLRNRPRVQEQSPHLFLFSANPENVELKKHLFNGGDACWYSDGWIWIQRSDTIDKMRVKEFPVTANGLAEFQIANVMAATAAALALGADRQQIAKSLQEFRANIENSGRFNIYQVDKSYVITDYGHNCDAFLAVGQMLDKLEGYKKTAVVAMPGDRRSNLMEEAADILIKHYENFIIKEDADRRGRAKGEVPAILEKKILRNKPTVPVRVIPNEAEAVRFALGQMQEKEIVIIFYERLKEILPVLFEFGALPVDHIPPADQLEIPDEWMLHIPNERLMNEIHQ